MEHWINLAPFRWPASQPDSSGYETAVAAESYTPLCMVRLNDQLDVATDIGCAGVRVDAEWHNYAVHPNPAVTAYDVHRSVGPITTFVARSGLKLEWIIYGDPTQTAAWKALNGAAAWTAKRPPSGVWPSAKLAVQSMIDDIVEIWLAEGRSLADLEFAYWNEPDQVGGPVDAAGQIWSFRGEGGADYPSFHDILQGIFGGLNTYGCKKISPAISSEDTAGYVPPTFVDDVLADIAALNATTYSVYNEFDRWATNQYNKFTNNTGHGMREWQLKCQTHARSHRDSFRAQTAFGINTKSLIITEGLGANYACRGSFPIDYQEYGRYVLAGRDAIRSVGGYDRLTHYTMSNGSLAEDTANYSYGIQLYNTADWRTMLKVLANRNGVTTYDTSPPSGNYVGGTLEVLPH